MSKIVVVDIDGTIANIEHRLHFIMNVSGRPPLDIVNFKFVKYWDKFYLECVNDKPIGEIIELVEMISEKYLIVFCTGRRESARENTIRWLNLHTKLNGNYNMLMRKDGDKRPDYKVKPELLDDYMVRNYPTIGKVRMILEDRDCMVKEWRKLGYKCLQVAEGNF